MNPLLIKYKQLSSEAGPDGLDPLAKQFMTVGLESMGIPQTAFNRNLYTFSNEAITGEDIIEFLKKVLDRILSSLSEWKELFMTQLNKITTVIRKKYDEWEIANVPLGDFDPIKLTVTNPHLFNGSGCILEEGKTYQSTDLVPGNNYRKFQIANGVMGLTGFGLNLLDLIASDSPDTSIYIADLIGELGDLVQPNANDNYGGWGISNYDRSLIQSLNGKSFKEASEELLYFKLEVEPVENTRMELAITDSETIIGSIKNAKKQLEFVEKILSDYSYIDSLSARATKAKAQLHSLKDEDLSDVGREVISEFHTSVTLYKQYCKINRDMMTNLAKTLIAVGDTYMDAYRKAKDR